MASGETWTPSTRGPQVEFTSRFVQPPSALYLSPDDRLYVLTQCVSSAQELALRARVLKPTGEIVRIDHEFETDATARASALEGVDLTEGFLLGVGVFNRGTTIRRGQLWAEIGVLRGLVVSGSFVHSLAAGYIESLSGVYWPGGGNERPLTLPGNLFLEAGTTPGAGNPISETVPTNARRFVRSLTWTLTTDATVANRRCLVRVIDVGPSLMFEVGAATVQAASSTVIYHAVPTGAQVTDGDGRIYIPIPANLVLKQAQVLSVNAANLQSGDQFSAPGVVYEELLEE